mmetsp:Transcript_22960/g.17399  ORF Transcript_22960/g.17399 Transcript_22960/m.17399 type:complete len:100 (+) Transcript_22960:672-971(+)
MENEEEEEEEEGPSPNTALPPVGGGKLPRNRARTKMATPMIEEEEKKEEEEYVSPEYQSPNQLMQASTAQKTKYNTSGQIRLPYISKVKESELKMSDDD